MELTLAQQLLGWFNKNWRWLLPTFVTVMLAAALSFTWLNASMWRARAEKAEAEARTCEKQRKLDRQAFDAASAQAKRLNEQRVATIIQKQNAVVSNREKDLAEKLDDARAAADDYLRRMRFAAAAAAANRSQGSQAGATADAARAAARPGEVPLLDEEDVRICTENTVIAQGWQGFWNDLTAIER